MTFLIEVLLERSDEADADVRTMSLGKANYARQGEQVTFRWFDFALVRNEDLKGAGAEIAANIQAGKDNAIFFACLDERTRQQRAVSENEASPKTFAPKVFAEMVESKGIGVRRLKGAMDRLYRIGEIERGYLWHAHRKPVEGLRRAREGAASPCGDLAATSCGDVRPPCGDPRETGGDTHPISKDIPGAPFEAGAPVQGNEKPDLSRVVFPADEVDEVRRLLDTPLPDEWEGGE